MLQTLDDCGSPPLAARAPTLSRPTSLKTSDHKSMLAFMGLPLDIFGKVHGLFECLGLDDLTCFVIGRIFSTLFAIATT